MGLRTVISADAMVDDDLGGARLGTPVGGGTAPLVSARVLCPVGSVPVCRGASAQALVVGIAGSVVDRQHSRRSHGGARRGAWFGQQPLRCSFVAVGHGTSVLLELPDGRTILYDAGRMGSPQAAVLPISSVLWSRRIAHIDAIVLSHADADHFNAVPELLDRFSVGAVYVSPVMFDNDTPALDALRASIVASDVPVKDLCEGARLATATGVEAEVLHPPPGGCRGGDNSNSIVLRIRDGGQSILLTGDLEGDGLDELLAELPLPCDVLLAPHHGSRRSRPQEMTGWAVPSLVVVSDGAPFGVPTSS